MEAPVMHLVAVIAIVFSLALSGCGSDGEHADGNAGDLGMDASDARASVDGGTDVGVSMPDDTRGGPAGEGGEHDGASNVEDVVADTGLFGIDPQTDVQTVSDVQKGQLCDWMNEKLGGYGQSYVCGGGVLHNDDNQAACVRAVFTGACVLPLEKLVACVEALAPTHGCDRHYDLCRPLYQCYVAPD
jgi:hypothetical protein